MTPDQQTALESVVGRSLSQGEVDAIDPLLDHDNRQDTQIAAILSAGRVAVHPKQLSERGVRALLPVTQAGPFLRLLKAASEDAGIPAWLVTVLSGVGVPEAQHEDYSDTLKSAWFWLRTNEGIDVGSAAARSMLDLIAASNPSAYGAACVSIKTAAEVPDPIYVGAVSDALNVAEGRMTL
jgi:hypothetical protein